MNRIWKIELWKGNGYYKVIIQGENRRKFTGKGPTAHMAYRDAECKMIIKPWLKSADCGVDEEW